LKLHQNKCGVFAIIAHTIVIADKIASIINNALTGHNKKNHPFSVVASTFFIPKSVKHNQKSR